MLEHEERLSLADLSASGVRLQAAEAVTIVCEVIAQVIAGQIPGVPSAHVIRILPSGGLTVEGPVAAGGRHVPRAAQLLDALLPGFDAGSEYRVPGALRLIVARALGTLDLPPHPSLDNLADALSRFAAPDRAGALRDLVRAARTAPSQPSLAVAAPSLPAPVTPSSRPPAASQGDPGHSAAGERRERDEHREDDELAVSGKSLPTISDIRRARRASGMPLAEIATRSRIPVGLLRQLEWGYLRHWPAGLHGRTQLVRYARAAGLDEQIVVRTVWPMLEAEVRQTAPPIDIEILDVELPGPKELGGAPFAEPGLLLPADKRRRGRLLAAMAIPAMIAIGLVPGVREEIARRLPSREAIELWRPQTASSRSAAAPPPAVPAAEPEANAANDRQAAVDTPALPEPTPRPRDAQAASGTTGIAPGAPVGAGPATPVAAAADDQGAAYSPTFASIASAMFYSSVESGATVRRAEASGDGATLRITRIVDDQSRNYHARPSPDGTRIAFDSDRDGVRGIYLADADGLNVRRVSGDGFAAVPSWSPDGRTLAFVRAEAERPQVWNLWLKDLDSGSERRLTSNREGQPWGATWFPDGRRLAFGHEERLVVLDIESGQEQSYSSPRPGRLVRSPAVSPDGRRIIFQVHRDGAWLLEIADGSMRKVLADAWADEYTWSPDGTRVAYHNRRTGEWGVWLLLSGTARR